jgi:hypothetical protein
MTMLYNLYYVFIFVGEGEGVNLVTCNPQIIIDHDFLGRMF